MTCVHNDSSHHWSRWPTSARDYLICDVLCCGTSKKERKKEKEHERVTKRETDNKRRSQRENESPRKSGFGFAGKNYTFFFFFLCQTIEY